jgi:lysophospholipase L1-like esterase
MALIAVLLTVIAVATFALVRRGSQDPPRSRFVPVIGDSITVLSAGELSAALGRYHPDIHAVFGQRIDQMLPTLVASLERRPDAVVVNLGTNDALQAGTGPDWHRGFARMIDLIDRTPCAVVTTISTFVDRPASGPVVASDINRAIADAAAAHPTIHVLDWNARLHAHGGQALVVADGIHPSAAGKMTLAAMTRRVLADGCRLGR